MNIVIEKEFRFEASHVLPKHPGKCARLHGHSWVLRVAVKGPVDPETGFVLDYAELKKLVNEHIVERLDHQHLGCGIVQHTPVIYHSDSSGDMRTVYTNVVPPFGVTFYPSSENLVTAIASLLKPLIPELKPHVRLYQISLDETCTSRATWTNLDAD